MALEQRDFYFFYISITFNMEIRRCCVLFCVPRRVKLPLSEIITFNMEIRRCCVLFCVPRRVKLPLSEIALQIEIEIDVHFKSRSNLSKWYRAARVYDEETIFFPNRRFLSYLRDILSSGDTVSTGWALLILTFKGKIAFVWDSSSNRDRNRCAFQIEIEFIEMISRCSRVWWRNNFFSESAIFELSARYFELGRHCEHRLSTPDFNLRGTQNKRNTYNEVKSLEVIFSDTRKRENNGFFSLFRFGRYQRPEPHHCPYVTLIRVRKILYF